MPLPSGRIDRPLAAASASTARMVIPRKFGTRGPCGAGVAGTTATAGARRNEDIALDLMKFVAVTTGYGKATSTAGGVGFERASGGASKPEEFATSLLQLYGKCLDAVSGKK